MEQKDTKVCSKCGFVKQTLDFSLNERGYGSVCKTCTNNKKKLYRIANKERISHAKSKCYFARREYYQLKHRHNIEKTPFSFLAGLYGSIKKRTRLRKHQKPDGRYVFRRPLKLDVDLRFLADLYARQSGRCALSGVKLVHQIGKLNAISIDRIDNGIGYVRGNIQLVCQFVNLGKYSGTNEAAKEFLAGLRRG
jgi:hypothetical protein